jgi:hypothetical protein
VRRRPVRSSAMDSNLSQNNLQRLNDGRISCAGKGQILSDDCVGELVVPLGDDRDCVAVAGLEGELVSCVCAAAACCVDR